MRGVDLQAVHTGWLFPLTEATRKSCGCDDKGGPAAQHSPRVAVSPAQVHRFLLDLPAVPLDSEEAELCAALALASTCGTPVTLTASLAQIAFLRWAFFFHLVFTKIAVFNGTEN